MKLYGSGASLEKAICVHLVLSSYGFDPDREILLRVPNLTWNSEMAPTSESLHRLLKFHIVFLHIVALQICFDSRI